MDVLILSCLSLFSVATLSLSICFGILIPRIIFLVIWELIIVSIITGIAIIIPILMLIWVTIASPLVARVIIPVIATRMVLSVFTVVVTARRAVAISPIIVWIKMTRSTYSVAPGRIVVDVWCLGCQNDGFASLSSKFFCVKMPRKTEIFRYDRRLRVVFPSMLTWWNLPPVLTVSRSLVSSPSKSVNRKASLRRGLVTILMLSM